MATAQKKNHIGRIHIGTSGWSYNEWNGPFYPDKLKSADRLDFYADHFNTVELNNTFYHLPKKQTVKHWAQTTPKNFCFAVKASRYITHIKRLKAPRASVKKFFAHIQPLKNHLGPILIQLPPNFKRNDENNARLDNFIRQLPKDHRYVFEFRHDSWFNDDVYDLLDKNDMGFCVSDLPGHRSPDVHTSDLVYYRFHGPKKKYEGHYSYQKLSALAQKFKKWAKDGREIYCYFDNTGHGEALEDAENLRRYCAS